VIIASQNDYVIGVKRNQPKLYEQISKTTSDNSKINSISEITERSKGRLETRHVSISNDLSGISKEWIGLKTIIKVERTVVKKQITTNETAFYIGSFKADAHGFNIGIRKHWSIENSLHYVKDVSFGEDKSKINTDYSAENFSLIRNIVINTYRKNGYENLKQAMRLHSCDIKKIKILLENK